MILIGNYDFLWFPKNSLEVLGGPKKSYEVLGPWITLYQIWEEGANFDPYYGFQLKLRFD